MSLENLLVGLRHELVDDDTTALAVVGSVGRGTASPESDVDVVRYVRHLPPDPEARYRVTIRDGRPIAVLLDTLENVPARFVRPEAAIWAVPYFRDMRILHDPDGELAAFHLRAATFEWDPLRRAADGYAAHRLMKFAEETMKLAWAVRRGDAQAMMTETTWLILGLPLVIAAQRGIFLENETRAPVQVQQAVGVDSAWAMSYRTSAGLDETASLVDRARAALRLYAESAVMLDEVLAGEYRAVVCEAIERASELSQDMSGRQGVC